MTHRVFSRNTSSSRAVPVKKVIEQVVNDPVIPLSFGRNAKGMASTTLIIPEHQKAAKDIWLRGRDMAVHTAEELANLEVHKQFVNRLLMPYTWITTIVSATEWDNFFALRTEDGVQPEMRHIAETMVVAYYELSHPTELGYGEWHLPLISTAERDTLHIDTACQVSTARCAAVSYLRQSDDRDVEDWLRVFDTLVKNGHMSPLEHVARAISDVNGRLGNFIGWTQYRHNYVDTRFMPTDRIDKLVTDYKEGIA